MEYKMLQDCPVCGQGLKITGLHCSSCHTQINGTFEPPTSRVMFLGKKDLDFVELFVKLRGNIKEMEKALGVSYPTVRGILDNVIRKMGFDEKSGVDEEKMSQIKAEILSQLEKGEISAAEAAEKLQSIG